MKFLMDVHIPPRLGHLLAADGHSFRMAVNITSPNASDNELLRLARENEEVMLTHDLDFGTLLAFNGDTRPSVIIFRIEKIHADIFYSLLSKNWQNIKSPLERGAIVIIEPVAVRIRELPVRQG